MTLSALELAITLRQQVRDALDRDDMPEVRRLNRLADVAYLGLNPWDALSFMAWIRGHVEVMDWTAWTDEREEG